MAEAALELGIFSPDGTGERPAGEAIEVGRIKSSRFIGSLLVVTMAGAGICCVEAPSLNLRSRAMPLGPTLGAGELVGIFWSSLFEIC
jgi:hypothetical protein